MATANNKPDFRTVTPLARLSYPHLSKPADPMNPGDKPKYQCELIFEKGTDIKALRQLATDCARNKWGDKMPKNLKTPFRSGDTDREDKDGYEGATFISARSTDKPGIIIGPNREPCLDESEVYGGCYVRASVTCFAWETKNKSGAVVSQGVSFALNNIWKVKDGEPFGNRRSAEDDFADLDSDMAESLL